MFVRVDHAGVSALLWSLVRLSRHGLQVSPAIDRVQVVAVDLAFDSKTVPIVHGGVLLSDHHLLLGPAVLEKGTRGIPAVGTGWFPDPNHLGFHAETTIRRPRRSAVGLLLDTLHRLHCNSACRGVTPKDSPVANLRPPLRSRIARATNHSLGHYGIDGSVAVGVGKDGTGRNDRGMESPHPKERPAGQESKRAFPGVVRRIGGQDGRFDAAFRRIAIPAVLVVVDGFAICRSGVEGGFFCLALGSEEAQHVQRGVVAGAGVPATLNGVQSQVMALLPVVSIAGDLHDLFQ
mmetsp:Transcript_18407/g.42267  ORF Transcript_18407/g.42267 Transcript_18407/m.42267 type:complete len:291 (+) Transcript_18407:317-1189(+)